MDILTLGPLEVVRRGERCRLGSTRRLRLLAALLHAEGTSLPAETLIDRLWDDHPPPSGASTLYSHISRLRAELQRVLQDQAEIEHVSGGAYRLRLDYNCVDAVRFRRLVKQADTAVASGDREHAVRLLRDAERLSRGEPFAQLSGAWLESIRKRHQEELGRVREKRIALELELGRHAELVAELRAHAAERPLTERITSFLMLALYRCGRQDEALALYRHAYRERQERLGLSPGATLQRLHQQILDADPALELADRPAAESGRQSGPRCDLPRDIPHFVGRGSELRSLLAEDCGAGTALPVTVVHGMPGVGKSALVLHAAHRLRERYPDAQLYVNLGGESGQSPSDPNDVLAKLLSATGLPPDHLLENAAVEARAARWRDWTARRRVLLVLDNARDAEQVLPLLPGSSSCRVLVTSRHRLAHLDGAHWMALDVLSGTAAMELFRGVVGTSRVPDPAALRRVVDLCALHPLALHVAADRFRRRESWGIGELTRRLTSSGDPLDNLDPESRIDKAFQLSYAELSDPGRRLFRLLALHPGSDLTASAASALAGQELARVYPVLDELTDCHLLEEPVADRYRLHDLVRQFAARAARREEPGAARQAARRRLLSHYLTVADRADRLTHPQRRRHDPDQLLTSAPTTEFSSAEEAEAWLDVERTNLLAAAHAAVDHSPAHAALFPHVLAQAFRIWGTWEAAEKLNAAALAVRRRQGQTSALASLLVERADVLGHVLPGEALSCAGEALGLFRAVGDLRGEAESLTQVGRARLAAAVDHAEALRSFNEALERHRRIGCRHGEAEVLNLQGVALYYAGRYDDALQKFRQMLAIERDVGDLRGQIRALNNLGVIDDEKGRYADARSHYEQSLALVRRVGGRSEVGNLYNNLGRVLYATGEIGEALRHFEKALRTYRAIGDARGEADTLINMGQVCRETGRHSAALQHLTTAEAIAERIGNAYERQRALISIAGTQYVMGQADVALATYRAALRLAEEIDVPHGVAQAHDGIARVLLARHGPEAAREHVGRAVTLYGQLGQHDEAEALRRELSGRTGQDGTVPA